MATIKQDYFGDVPYVYTYTGALSNSELDEAIGNQLGLGESMYSNTIDGVRYVGTNVALTEIVGLAEVIDTL